MTKNKISVKTETEYLNDSRKFPNFKVCLLFLDKFEVGGNWWVAKGKGTVE